MLAPFLAPYDPTRGHAFRSAILLAKYAATVASATILYHLHSCFSLQRSVVAALSASTSSKMQLDIASQEWWTGRLLLMVLSLSMQKVPVAVVQLSFRIEQVRIIVFAIVILSLYIGQGRLCRRCYLIVVVM
jgi:hypothetical protein